MSFENQKQEEEKFQEKENKEIKPKRSLINKKSFVIFSLIAIFLMLIYAGTVLDRKSRIYIDSAMPTIFTSWNSQELISRASPSLLENSSPEKIEKLFKNYSNKLGRMQEYKGSCGTSRIFFAWFCQEGFLCPTITAEYISEVVFDNGLAQIETGMHLRNGKWEIVYLSMSSDAFLSD